MKKRAVQLVVALMMVWGTTMAQDIGESQVPSVVRNSFKKDFGKAKDVEWEKKADSYKVEFEMGGWFADDFEAWYDTTGLLIKYVQEIPNRDLPTAIKELIKKQYPTYRVDDVEKHVKNHVETYWVEIEKKNDELVLVFDKDGKLKLNNK